MEECGDAVRRVVSKVHETQKAGSVTITLKFEPATKKQSRQIKVTENVACSVPRLSGEALYFATDEGGLSRMNPDQGRLGLEANEDSTL